ncbi:MAG: hypothetical protein M3O78_06420, partial [Chloroflexota bacterium]|nr:hypothetical protein [Chloroflexota bacterium]
LGDVVQQLTDRQPRKVSVLRRDEDGHATRAISHVVPFDPAKLTQLGVALLDGIEAQAAEGDPADAAILRAAWTVDFGEAAARALAQAGHPLASGQMAMAASEARQALATAGVEFSDRTR